jgi:hypothetical protein
MMIGLGIEQSWFFLRGSRTRNYQEGNQDKAIKMIHGIVN